MTLFPLLALLLESSFVLGQNETEGKNLSSVIFHSYLCVCVCFGCVFVRVCVRLCISVCLSVSVCVCVFVFLHVLIILSCSSVLVGSFSVFKFLSRFQVSAAV
jgi:hypothetical protein